MVSVKDANAIAEVIYYLKGIKKQDVVQEKASGVRQRPSL